jgi:HPt (histidine-containing phosphotransfer) domain-containing protein
VNPTALYEKLLHWLDKTRKDRRPVVAAPSPTTPSTGALDPAELLAAVSALDVARGMSLFAGQHALYIQALGYFVDLYRNGLSSIDLYLARHPDASRAAVGREIHSMGGAAAALGAVDLEASARRVDALVRADRDGQADDSALRVELESLRAALAELVGQLRAALGDRADESRPRQAT